MAWMLTAEIHLKISLCRMKNVDSASGLSTILGCRKLTSPKCDLMSLSIKFFAFVWLRVLAEYTKT
ncbi:hypothetical protein AKJ16_DCAP24798 [Drosera capensis]